MSFLLRSLEETEGHQLLTCYGHKPLLEVCQPRVSAAIEAAERWQDLGDLLEHAQRCDVRDENVVQVTPALRFEPSAFADVFVPQQFFPQGSLRARDDLQ